MAWAKIDESAPLHPKMVRAGVAAFGFDVAGIAYCNRNLTDGFVPASDFPVVFPGLTPREASDLADKLVKVGRWRKDDARNGFIVHDYEQYQPTRSEVLQKRRETQTAKVAGGRARASVASRLGGRFTSNAAAEQQQQSSDGPGDEAAPADQQSTSPVSVSVPVSVVSPSASAAPTAPTPGRGEPTEKTAVPTQDKHHLRAVIQMHAAHFQKLVGKPLVVHWAKDAARVKPVLDAHGLDVTLKLQKQFFESAQGWWVKKHNYGIGAFVSAVDELAATDSLNEHGHSPVAARILADAERAAELIRQGAQS